MKLTDPVIYYFTGTGNTLAVARGIAEKMTDTRLIPMRRAMSPGGACVTADVVGIAFPVYYLDMPELVRQFVEQLRFEGDPYIYAVATCGGRPGGALYRVAEALEKRGSHLSAGFSIIMPENYLGPVDLMEPEEEAQRKISASGERIEEIVRAIEDRKTGIIEGDNSLKLRLGGAITRFLMTSVYRTPRQLHVTDKCNRCTLCEKLCPTWNISIEPEGIRFSKYCTQCYACIHWCPKEAIEIGGRTEGKRRYHHPDVTIRDILNQRGE